MRLFGILLIPLILIAGGGYVYLASQDYKGRQQINAAGLRHLLLLQGLPMEGEDFAADDETPFQARMAGGESTKTVSKKLLESYFRDNAVATPTPAATGAEAPPATTTRVPLVPPQPTPVVSQWAETKRVFAILKGEFKEGLTPAQKVALAQEWLLIQAETMAERLRYQALAATVDAEGVAKPADKIAADADELVHALDLKIYRVAPKLYESETAALAPAKWAELQKKVSEAGDEATAARLRPVATDAAERRERLAHLLVHLDRDAAWQKRVAVIVGLRRYVSAIATQAARFREMRDHIDLPISADQAVFQTRQTLLMNEARQNVDRARSTAEERAKLVEQKTAADDAVNRRQTQIDALKAQLQKVTAEVDALLVQQTGIEKQLYEIQREVGLTLEQVYRLEALLIDVERERYGLPPRTRP